MQTVTELRAQARRCLKARESAADSQLRREMAIRSFELWQQAHMLSLTEEEAAGQKPKDDPTRNGRARRPVKA